MQNMTRIVKETDWRGESVYYVEDAWWFFWKKVWFRPEPFLHPRGQNMKNWHMTVEDARTWCRERIEAREEWERREKKTVEVIEYVN